MNVYWSRTILLGLSWSRRGATDSRWLIGLMLILPALVGVFVTWRKMTTCMTGQLG